ncbi:CoA-substrate-specific enzyme activase, putative [Succiniclasticum ruminis]|uniref:CoA-substrate-specific enzyme activase, putative n=1 Tax=Succiniclasticum ruminis TaxID=40841 RepID=A0A1G6HYI7_9FIRM|nr:acyl-CoA dehydratase activase-related protein [Succiniclasticum ruminis]SDB99291.1 CoA-substrate-specific enzyme activase, putative [Succiniclasticum ruminis]
MTNNFKSQITADAAGRKRSAVPAEGFASYKVGIDIGSTTIKVVVLDAEEHIVYKHYARHFSDIPTALVTNLTALQDVVGPSRFRFALTGSAGMGIAQRLQLPFVQEVIAAATAVKKLIPQTDTMVELGGEDAKIMYFGSAPEERMNGVCAGGTGAFIDHMAALLNTDAKGLNDLAANARRIYTIASRCGVFAKTDIQALMNDGASKEDIAKSIFQAVVNQTIGNLAQGREITGNVAFLGGPLYFLPELKKRFIETLKMDPEHVVNVEDGAYFVAVGAALSEETKELEFKDLTANLDKAEAGHGIARDERLALFRSSEEYDAFIERHNKDKVKRGDLATYAGPVYVGIDAGSTTTKIVAIGSEKEILYTDYGSNQGSPLKIVIKELTGLYHAMPKTAWIAGCLTTGYGENIVKAALHADEGEVETFAHYRAAYEFCPEVTCVLDIGGQDMKCFQISNGNIGKITLNEACSAGCGSFIENFAQGLGMSAAEFADKAMDSKTPVDLGTRCTVFMNSRVKQAQKEGAPLADISAGIGLSVIKNALFKVMQLKDVSELGDHIVVQGGTFYNNAVLRNMEKLLGKDVIRPDIAGLMGAYGAAILSLEKTESEAAEAATNTVAAQASASVATETVSAGTRKHSTLLGPEKLANFTVTTKSYRCNGCGNHCLVTMQTFPDGGRYFTGNRCERGEGKPKNNNKAPNIYEYKYQRLFNYPNVTDPAASCADAQTGASNSKRTAAGNGTRRPNAPRGVIGIPRVLNMYEDFPFWATFFGKLGYDIVLSGKSNPMIYYKGMSTIPSDSLCYPAKLVHGHVMDLVEKGVKRIFYPCMPYNMEDDVNHTGNHYNCPVVASYAENIRNNMDVLRNENIAFIEPFLPINNPKKMLQRLTEVEFFTADNITSKELKAAMDAGYKELEQYREDVRNKGKEILQIAKEKNLPVILLVGRPYHIDPEINHGIPEMIQSYNLAIVSEDSVYHMDTPKDELSIVNQWSYHARLYHAASFAAAHPEINLIQLSSFGCGLDAITTNQVREIMEGHQRLYTMIKLDEVSNLGAARIRLRSLLAVLSRRHVPGYQPIITPERPHFTHDCKGTHTILAPQMAPIHFNLISHVLNRYGYQVVIPETPKEDSINLGLQYVQNDMCYPAIVVIGQMLQALKSGKYDPDNTSIVLFQTCGACRATNYLNLMRRALRNAGFPQVPAFACWGLEQDAFRLNASGFKDVAKAVVYGDLLQNVTNRMRPYELIPGSTDKLFAKWMAKVKEELDHGNFLKYRQTIQELVQEFDAIPLIPNLWKPKVGVVGEILVEYHPVANNHLEEVLAREGAEVVMPELANFLLYMAFDGITRHDILDGSWLNKVGAQMFIKVADFFMSPMRKALAKSKHFTAPVSIYKVAELAAQHVSLGNMAGEGWLLPGEMTKLMEEGVRNVVCLQPWACLPNHILGKGVFREIRRTYEDANLVAMDCDAGASEVNQLNRLKLMLSVAKEKCPEGMQLAATAENADNLA